MLIITNITTEAEDTADHHTVHIYEVHMISRTRFIIHNNNNLIREMTGEMFTAWSLFTVFTGGEEEGQEAAVEAGPPLSGVRRGAGAVSWSAAGDQGVALQHNTGNTRYIYTLYPSSLILFTV